MPQFYIELEKKLGSEFWTNRYIAEAVSLEAANAQVAVGLLSFERALHTDVVTFTRYRVSTVAEGDDTYVIIPVNQLGQRGIASSSLLPLFNTLRVDLPTSSGRPSRKYYRGVLLEGDINGDAVETNFNSFMAALVNLFADAETPGLVDPQGSYFTNAVPIAFVQMRQLRRSRRRRTNGGGVFQ